MPQPPSTTYLNPRLGQVPGSVTAHMLHLLVCSLPLPGPGGPADAAHQALEDALADIDAAGPRDRREAKLVVREVALLAQADALMMRAVAETDPVEQERLQKRMLALQRAADAMGRALRRHRRGLAAEGLQHVPPWTQVVDLAALEQAWQQPEAVLPADLLTPQPTDPASIWPVAPAATEEAGPPAPATGLEDRDEFEVPPRPKFQGVPLWRQNGRRWLDELPDEELAEVTAAQQRGEEIEEPPVRPAGMALPKGQEWRRGGNWLSPESLAAAQREREAGATG